MNSRPDPADLATLRAQFQAVRGELLLRDAARLARQLARGRDGRFDGARFVRDVERARLAAENRARLKPATIAYPPELPVVQAREELLAAIREHQVIVVCGETGSGKTTQLPKLCLELGRGLKGLIGHTQPRRLAARSVAQRIARELDTTLGELVGYETRFDRRVSERSLVKLMTDGILLAELQRDHELSAYDTIIIDEAHERTLNIDFLLGWLKRLLPRRPELKLIITSATLDPERLARHFGGAPILTVSGRMYPVEIRYRDTAEDDLEDGVAGAIDSLWRGPAAHGDVLVFLPGEREIRDLARALPGRFPRAEVLSLYSRLPAAQQDRVFSPGRAPRIILSTNVAETSVTVPGIRYVVDAGTARINRYAPRLGVQQLHIEPIAQSAANQRAGRCGRVGPGICVRLYTEDDFQARAPFTTPEILRANLAGVILQMAALGLGDLDDFPWVDPPEHRQVAEAWRLLEVLGAVDALHALTPLGRELARLPLDPRIARMVLAARGTAAQDAVCVLAAALSVQDPHEVPPEAQDAARAMHAHWRHPRSDFFSLLNLWARWQQWSEAHSNRQLRRLCHEHFVSFLRMEEWEAVHRQIVDLVGDGADAPRGRRVAELAPAELESMYAPVHQALLAGLVDHIGNKLPEKSEFQGPRNRRFKVFPGSGLAKKPPPWIMSAQLVQTSQLFARVNAAIEPDWLLEVAPHLVKRVLHHPTWDARRGEVTAIEHVSLLGLPLLQRPRHYGSSEPREARAIFIREALVGGDWPGKPEFLQHNLALVAEVRDKEARLRRPDLLADEAQLYAFYDARVPAEVCTVAGLKSWLRARAGSGGGGGGDGRDPGAALRMAEADVLRPGANADVATLFPDHLDVGGHALRLSYTHDPGADVDGVTFHLPLALLHSLPEDAFDWLVPGLRAGKIEGLIRTLPPHLRRLCQPAADYARALAQRLVPEGALLPAMCAAFRDMTGVQLQPADFQPHKLEPYLQPRLQLEDESGRVLASAGTLAELRAPFAGAARQAFNAKAREDERLQAWTRQDLADWDFDALPEVLTLDGGGRAWPALQAEGARVDLRLFESAEAAAAAQHAGVRALLLRRMPERVRDLGKSVRTRLALLLPAFRVDAEAVTQALLERSAEAQLLTAPIRDRAAFQAALERRAAFSQDAQKRLDELHGWLTQARALRQRLDALGNRWPLSIADARAQLDSLFDGDFLRAIPEAQWQRIAVYLKALALRLERLPNKPARDEDLTRPLQTLLRRLPQAHHAARWPIEEWRVALFAQELKAVGAPDARKIEALLPPAK